MIGGRRFGWCIASLVVSTALACGGDDDVGGETFIPTSTGPIVFTSPAFESGGTIPPEYTCDGPDTSPPLEWSTPPAGTQSFAIEMLDRDADGFVHWLIFDIEPSVTRLSPAVDDLPVLFDGSMQAINTFGEARYGGPCPPAGQPHEYVFTIYALDTAVPAAVGVDARDIQQYIAEHTLAASQLAAVYGR